MGRLSLPTGALAMLLALPVGARPAFTTVEVKVGDVAFARLYEVRLLASADPAIATGEHQPATGELLVTGHAPGTTDLIALSGGKLVGVRVRVRAEGHAVPESSDAETLLSAAKKACPGLTATVDGKERRLEITAPSEVCRTALDPLLATGQWTVPQTRVNFDTTSLGAQLNRTLAALKSAGIPELQLHYQGATLVLAGHLSRAAAERALVILYQTTIGGVPLNDDDLTLEGDPDGGP